MKPYVWLSILIVLGVFVWSCSDVTDQSSIKTYASLTDSVHYVGKETCISCHSDVWETYQHTGMGSSYGPADTNKSVLKNRSEVFYDEASDFYYQNIWKENELYIKEFRLHGKDTIHQLIKKIDDVVGSGHHTNSHIYHQNGYYYQAPFTFYVQDGEADIPPGFENGFNSRFSRPIGLECMSCHNSLPEFVKGSENKFKAVPEGINCERCHGPGSQHVADKKSGKIVDIAKEIDYSIVNPAKLSMDLQFDICQRCHLQGNTILKEGKSFYDFKPGMKLSDVMSVFLPRYDNNDEFIMASHADRLQMSQCFIASKDLVSDDPIRPTKFQMTCITCHHPHESVQTKSKDFFDQKCMSCHQEQKCKANEVDNCVSCHMPKSSSVDIPHVSITDHKIAVHQEKAVSSGRSFVDLASINNPSPTEREKLAAYINQFEKFDKEPMLLEKASEIIEKQEDISPYVHEAIHYYTIQKDYQSLFKVVNLSAVQEKIKTWKSATWDNKEAWTLYRIAEAYFLNGIADKALVYINQASDLAPYHLEIRNKQASIFMKNGQAKKAQEIWEWILKENSEFTLALNNLGFIKLINQQLEPAKLMFEKVIALDPDYRQAYLNLGQVYISQQNFSQAIEVLNNWLQNHQDDVEVQRFIQQIRANEKGY